ncbi:MAG: divergent polysaccharide deacetylase family protein [Holophagae bacterium]|jgi:polysaccharide deacetylase 2 family uncharacterized protein YibQ
MSSSKKKGGGKGRARSASRTRQWLPVVWIIGAAVIVVAVLWWLGRGHGSALQDSGQDVEEVLKELSARHGVTEARLDVDRSIVKRDGVFVRSWRLVFPSSAEREEFLAEATILADRGDLEVGDPTTLTGRSTGLRIDHGIEAFELELAVDRPRRALSRPRTIRAPTPTPPTPTPRPQPPPDARGRMAILLDDAGQQDTLIEAAGELPEEVGIAVLPFLPYSVETAVALGEDGHEIWLHLPMEAVGDSDPGPGALRVDMSDDELRDAVHRAINNIPGLVGVNNHMGSKATADLRMMTWVMQELAPMDLAFLDSRTTVDTVAEVAARAQGVPTGRRHVFLDNERSPSAIRAQLDEAVYRARMDGEVIAIGHLNEVTVRVLQAELPKLSERRVTLVRPTELMH